VRVLSVSHYAPPHVGGLEAIVDALASQLVRRGHEVTAVSSTAGIGDGLGVPRARPFDYRMIHVPAFNKFLERRLGVPYPLFAPALISVLRREVARADVVHVHGFLFQSTLVAQFLARRAAHRPVTVLTEHVGHVPYSNPVLDRTQAAAIATLGRWSARRADAAVAYNRSVEQLIDRIAPRTRLEWIDNGVDTEAFRPPSPSERSQLRASFGWDERPRVLFGGRAVAKKGLDVALDAARIGDGAFLLAVVGAMQAPPGASHVERVGLLSRERMAEAFRAADAVLLPSRGEGLPVTIQEALASGLPVVATDDLGYSKALDGAGDSVRLLPADADVMAKAVIDLVGRTDVTGSRQQAVEFARSSFSLDAFASRHERLYAELLDGRGRSSGEAAGPVRAREVAR